MQISLLYNYDNYNAEECIGSFPEIKIVFIIAYKGGKLPLVGFIE